MSKNETLLPCPICGSEAEQSENDAGEWVVCCTGRGCLLGAWASSADIWQSLPRRSDELGAIMADMETWADKYWGATKAIHSPVAGWIDRLSAIRDSGDDCGTCPSCGGPAIKDGPWMYGHKMDCDVRLESAGLVSGADTGGGECDDCGCVPGARIIGQGVYWGCDCELPDLHGVPQPKGETMSKRKLIRATVPMCPRCNGEMNYRLPTGQYKCIQCGCYYHNPPFGYYAPDVAGVVAEMRAAIVEMDNDCHACAKARTLQPWADTLEGKSDE